MPEFDEYLERIRAALDVSPRRAEEICAEVRTHLEERAQQLAQSGATCAEAVVMAVRDFGDPTDVARGLAAANRRHRSVSVLRVVVGFAVAFVGMVVSFGLIEGRAIGIEHVSRWVEQQGPLLGPALTAVQIALLMTPAAFAAGVVAGRRWSWIAGAPMALFGAVVLLVVERPAEESVWGGAMLLVGAPLAAGFAYLGSRVPQGQSRWYAAGALGAAYFLGLGAAALLVQAHGEVDFLKAAGIGMLVLGVLGTVSLWQAGAGRRRLAALATVVCAGCLWGVVKLTNTWFGTLAPRTPAYPVWAWRGLVAAEVAIALGVGAAVLITRRRFGRRDGQAVGAG